MNIDTVTDAASAVLPVAAAVAGAVSPQASGAIAVAPMVLQLLQTAMQVSQAGILPPDQLAQLFADVGKGIASTHAQWTALNAAPINAPKVA